MIGGLASRAGGPSSPASGERFCGDEDHGFWRIGLVDASSSQERAAVAALREQAYAGAPEFDWLDPAALDWSDTDDHSAVLGLWRQGRHESAETLLCTVRATVFGQLDAAEAFLEHALDGVNARAPALVLGRAACAPGQHGRGLLALLRVSYLRVLPELGVRSVLAVVYDQAPRVRSMQAAGFMMTPAARSWDSEARARTTPLVAHLPQERFASALNIAIAQTASAPAAAIDCALALAGPMAEALRLKAQQSVPAAQPA